MPKLKLKRFDMSSVPDNKRVVFIGKTGTGKSILVKDFLYHKQNTPVCVAISGTERASPFYRKMIPKNYIHYEYDISIIQKFMERQELISEMKDKEREQKGFTNIDNRSILILDDCLYDDSWAKTKEVREILMNGRHHGISFLVTMQYPLGIPPALRTQVDYVFILRENIIQNRKRIYDAYAGMFPTFDIFCQVMDQCTENHHCLVLFNGADSNKLEDQVFWYKANMHSDFQIGHPDFWRHAQNNLDVDSPAGKKEEPLSSSSGRKSKIIVNVERSKLPNLF